MDWITPFLHSYGHDSVFTIVDYFQNISHLYLVPYLVLHWIWLSFSMIILFLDLAYL